MVRRDHDCLEDAGRCWERGAREGAAGGEVGQGGEGGEGLLNAEEEAAFAERPEVVGVVVQTPLGAGEDFAGGKLNEEGGDHAVLVVDRVACETREQAAQAVGDEEVVAIDEVYGEDGGALIEGRGGGAGEAEGFEGDAGFGGGGFGFGVGGCREGEENEQD